MGEVYLAEQVSLKRQVAIKLVRPEVETAASGANPAERFAREAQAIAAMEHPHILPVYDFGEQSGLAYLVMAYAPNGSLQEALTPGHPSFRFGLPLSLELAGVVVDQAARALQHAHDRGVLHRDVKPANFLMGAGSPGSIHLLLADFGLAKFTSGAANSAVYSGTAAYSAPEQIQRQALPASDQYSLAAMVYLLLTGQLPFQGGLLEVVTKQLAVPAPPMRAISPAIPAEVDEAVLRALAKNPGDRWPSVIVFAAAYREACARARGSAASRPAAAPLASPLPQPLPGAAGAPQAGGAPVLPAPQAATPLSPPLAATDAVPQQRLPPAAAGATQVAPLMPGGAPFVPAPPMTMQARQSADDSFVAAGPLPPPPILPSYARPRRSWTAWAALAGGVSVVVAIVLIVTLVMGRPGGNSGQPNAPGVTGTPGLGSAVPVVPSGPHIKSIQTGLGITGNVGDSCRPIQIENPTTSFHQTDEYMWLIYTAENGGSHTAEAGVALLDSKGQLILNDAPQPITCPGAGKYASFLKIAFVDPGQYILGVFYSETFTIPEKPEVTLPVTISR
jgi:hypothetical protein